MSPLRSRKRDQSWTKRRHTNKTSIFSSVIDPWQDPSKHHSSPGQGSRSGDAWSAAEWRVPRIHCAVPTLRTEAEQRALRLQTATEGFPAQCGLTNPPRIYIPAPKEETAATRTLLQHRCPLKRIRIKPQKQKKKIKQIIIIKTLLTN